jgi:hypothetical protein
MSAAFGGHDEAELKILKAPLGEVESCPYAAEFLRRQLETAKAECERLHSMTTEEVTTDSDFNYEKARIIKEWIEKVSGLFPFSDWPELTPVKSATREYEDQRDQRDQDPRLLKQKALFRMQILEGILKLAESQQESTQHESTQHESTESQHDSTESQHEREHLVSEGECSRTG